MGKQDETDLQRQIDELVAQIEVNSAEIDTLTHRADAADARADAAESRGYVAEARADASHARADLMEARLELDRQLIAELQADGVVSREHAVQLERALLSSRVIGMAIGILMASRNVDQDDALALLKGASSRTNRPMRELAASIVAGSAS
ncbi:ANTAR domain-containing protein [Nocardioides sp. SR21]|uniref:ANTAR domain-containing protein n=1 Tax=Nocardioides sp. SR21 TaxID=2919501 RepID=UPI001FAA305C|nr:ANTAR domain-containing protein [Nocardioides sp. SR21]